MSKGTCDILNLEWSSKPSRDRIASTLVANYLRYQGLSVIEGNIFKGYQLIREKSPKILFINGAVGARINHHLVKFAVSKGVKVVSFSAEGNYTEDHPKGIDPFFWGWNLDELLYEDFTLVWSRRVKNLILNKHPELDSRILISGGIGFDNYKIEPAIKKDFLLQKYKKASYEKIIGVGCWNFGGFYPESPFFEAKQKRFSEEQIKRFLSDASNFNRILREVIEENPDILFLIKEHPGRSEGHRGSGVQGLDSFENVLIFHREESIKSCLEASDFWLFYESTTSLESWLMNKMTFKLNPSGEDFIRNNIHKGSPLIETKEQLAELIGKFYNHEEIEIFEKLEDERILLIENIIGNNDGLNHVRAGNVILNLYENIDQVNSYAFKYNKQKLDELKIRLSYMLNKKVNDFDKNEMLNYALKQYQLQKDFYQEMNLDNEKLKQIVSYN